MRIYEDILKLKKTPFALTIEKLERNYYFEKYTANKGFFKLSSNSEFQ